MKSNHYFIFAGEASGDLHGGHLIKSIRSLQPNSTFIGVGGPLMRSEGLSGPLVTEDFQVMGFTDVIKALPKLFRAFFHIRGYILEKQPDTVILIDYPGFNLRLAKALRKQGYKGKIVQYICPSVWAHGKGRIKVMAENLDLLLTIFPFEGACFAHTPLRVEYIGNPLAENYRKWADDQKLQPPMKKQSDIPLIALFPGSRLSEVLRHTPLLLKAGALLKKQLPQIKLAISYAHEKLLPILKNQIAQSHLTIDKDIFLIPPTGRYELMHECNTAIAMSGTVTLELAMHEKPTLMICELSKLNFLIAKYVLRLKLPHFCIVNILGKKEIFPEVIGTKLDVQEMAAIALQLHLDENLRKRIIEDCREIKQGLGERKTHQAAAEAMIRLTK